ncbi:hypothetical protein ASG29_10715 [Sphingomonas sp. Leaf412]|uniref:DUF4403 family protein n=1 Tax=Sphingomonas sp. Leaf412 TaxID=1736370 RepID=UPI0006F7DBB7|nr:DUF4403 family protein [Sphingomonas sp. Leaf412]KQT32281.1 hypothetical protein ASG29_10715 [Sphingomonas sp. Leaf412]
MALRNPSAPALLLLLAGTVAGCGRDAGNPAPPRATGTVDLPGESSTIVVPVTASLDAVERGLDRETPQVLWRIDQHRDRCIAGRKVAGVKVTPDLGCRIVGEARRGRITVAGAGERLTLVMPVTATVRIRDLGGVAGETATAVAMVRANARLGIVDDWRPRATIDIGYAWRREPGIDILGQRVTFTRQADEKLKDVVAKLERDLPRHLARMDVKAQLDRAWAEGFTTIQLNRRNPPAWMRVTPRAIGVGGYRVDGRQLRLTLAAEALTESFVGDRPADPVPTPLPPPSRVASGAGLRFFIPVLADYRQLEPVVQRELRELATKGITLAGVGAVDATFGKVTIYATEGNRLAVGVRTEVKARDGSLGVTKGEVWLTALPWNAEGSQVVQARDIGFATKTDSQVVNLLVRLFESPAVLAGVEGALRHDFAGDYAKVLAKAQAAIGSRRRGDFLLSAHVTRVTNGRIRATAQGLFLPVRAEGEARIEYRPR